MLCCRRSPPATAYTYTKPPNPDARTHAPSSPSLLAAELDALLSPLLGADARRIALFDFSNCQASTAAA